MNQVGKVSISGQLAGFIEKVDGGTKFAYTSEWLSRSDAVPVSLTLPLRREPYLHIGLHPFFENLLPEGWFLGVASTKLKISTSDSFALLLATCGDCVGSVEIEPVESTDIQLGNSYNGMSSTTSFATSQTGLPIAANTFFEISSSLRS